MATGVYSWSQTAGSNNTADSAINWSEGQAPSSVNDSARGMMSVLAKWRDDISGVSTSNAVLTTGGSANAQTLTTNGSIGALTNGWTITFKAGFTNTSDCTFAPDSLTAKHIRRISGTNLIGGEIIAGACYTISYRATADEWLLIDSQPIPGMQLLTYGTASGSDLSLVLTGYTAFRAIKFVLTGFQPATSGATLYARTSTNGGSSYDSSSGNYGYATIALSSGGSTTDTDTSTSATQIDITDANVGQSNSSNRPGNFEVTLFNQTSATLYTALTWSGSYFTTVGNVVLLQGTGARLTAADVDAIRFLYSSGNISAGNYAVYGIF